MDDGFCDYYMDGEWNGKMIFMNLSYTKLVHKLCVTIIGLLTN
jgi:hypothetical protein